MFLIFRFSKILKWNYFIFQRIYYFKFGRELYEAFVKNYTKKQWDKYPSELDKSVLERLPIKYDEDPYYFPGQLQGMPLDGFTEAVKNMLSDENIKIQLNTCTYTVLLEKIERYCVIFLDDIIC